MEILSSYSFKSKFENQGLLQYKMYKLLLLGIIFQTLLAKTPAPRLPTNFVKLKAYTGDFLSICIDCGYGSYPDSASLESEEPWFLEYVGQKVSFRSSMNGLYLSRNQNFWYNNVNYPDNVFVFADKKQGGALWTPILRPNKKYAFLSDNGKFLSRSKLGNFVFVSTVDDECVQWEISECSLPTITLQADDGNYLRVNPNIGPNLGTALTIEGKADAWGIVKIGDKIALRGPNGMYLSRCLNCWPGGVYPDAAFAHVTTPDGPWSQWTPIKQPNGKWVFQSDTGKYLARCYNCASSSPVLNLVFVHETNPSNPWVQWTLA